MSKEMQQWEYTRICLDVTEEPSFALAKDAGRVGWELVTAYVEPKFNTQWFIFKRPKQKT